MNAKAKKIKEIWERSKKKFQTSKKIFAFAFAFARCERTLDVSRLFHLVKEHSTHVIELLKVSKLKHEKDEKLESAAYVDIVPLRPRELSGYLKEKSENL